MDTLYEGTVLQSGQELQAVGSCGFIKGRQCGKTAEHSAEECADQIIAHLDESGHLSAD